jgi:hypothetical protein
MTVAQALRKTEMVVLMVNALGNVIVMPPAAVTIVAKPKVSDAELNELDEDLALQVLLKEGRPEGEIVEYLKRREVSVNP